MFCVKNEELYNMVDN